MMGPPQDALFKFEVPWATADREGIADKKMRPWVQKKLIEFLGEDEPALTGAVRLSPSENTTFLILAEFLFPWILDSIRLD